ncbi:MAG TPA: tRNA-binding protein [Smithellaceae bacterium]|jgi:tRNA-binding protein|nr:tRNA-binding protein [Smithellaceae bacterium]HPK17002.1 tRNA-binding protein [Clostridia bacterium]
MIAIEDFEKVDMRVGTVISASINEKARNPAYKLAIDFGGEIGVKTSSAQLTALYTADRLIGMQVVAVINFPPRQVAGVRSEVLVLGCSAKQGTVLLHPAETVGNGDRIY